MAPRIRRSYVPSTGLEVKEGNVVGARELRTPRATYLAELNLHYRTLMRCETGIEHIKAMADRRQHSEAMFTESLEEIVWSGVLVEYARSFAPAGSAGIPSRSVFTASAEHARHEFWMAQRSKHIAHDVNGWRHSRVAVMVDGYGNVGSLVCSVQQAVIRPEDVAEVQALVRKAIDWVRSETDGVEAELAAELEQIEPAWLLRLPPFAIEPPVGSVDAARRPSRRPRKAK